MVLNREPGRVLYEEDENARQPPSINMIQFEEVRTQVFRHKGKSPLNAMMKLYAAKRNASAGPSNAPRDPLPAEWDPTAPAIPERKDKGKKSRRSPETLADEDDSNNLGEPNKLRGILGLSGPRVNIKELVNDTKIELSVAQLLDCSPALRQELARVLRTNKPAPTR